MMLGMGQGNTSIVLSLIIIAVWAIVNKVLNNRRTVTRQELHGTVTYTIKGYSGPEAQRLADALRFKTGQSAPANVVKITKMGDK